MIRPVRSAAPLSDKTQADILKTVTAYRWLPAASNLFSVRREALIAPLTRLAQGAPGIILDPRCIIAREALSGKFAFRQLKNAFAVQVTEEPVKNHPYSDIADAICYGVVGAGEHMALVDLGRKRHKRADAVWDMRSGKWRDPITGELGDHAGRPVRVAKGLDYDPLQNA